MRVWVPGTVNGFDASQGGSTRKKSFSLSRCAEQASYHALTLLGAPIVLTYVSIAHVGVVLDPDTASRKMWQCIL